MWGLSRVQAWQRPTLPCLETQYHWRWSLSLPSSGWDRVVHAPQGPPGQRPGQGFIRGISRCTLCLWRVVYGGSGMTSVRGMPCMVPKVHARTGQNSIRLVRAISKAQLHALPRFHMPPINVMVCDGSSGNTCFEVSFTLRCFQRLSGPHFSYPAMRLAPQPVHQRCVHPGPLVLGTDPLNIPTPAADRDRTVSRRSEPSSRTTLIGEQPNPWELLHPQDVMSRHRGAKRLRRCGRLGVISLLSLEYLLSVERWPVHVEPPDHYGRLSSLLDMYVSQSGRLMPLHSPDDFRPS